MMSRPGTERAVLAGLLALFICRAVVAGAIVPPWQGPDEPTHFSLAYGLTMPTLAQQRVERGVLESMVRHGWWDLYEDPPPDPLPTSLTFLFGLGPGTLAQPLYYGLGAAVLRLSGPPDLETAYVHLRVLSVVLAIITLAVGWAGTRLLFGPEIAAGAAAIGALHPQFLLAAVSVNSDALLNVCGAFVWWQAARVITGRQRAFSLALLLIGAAAALFTKRLGTVLVAVAATVAAASLFTYRWRRLERRDLVMAGVLGGAGAAVLVGVTLVFGGEVDAWARYVGNALTIRRPLETATIAEAFNFLRMTVDYSWLIAGWLRFEPPDAWIWMSRLLIIGGMAGAAVVLFESGADRPRFVMAWFFVAAQVTAMLFAVFWTIPSAPQARYLFPVFAPITVLLYVGLKRSVPRTFHQHWPVALVLVLAAMDVTGFTTVHIPTYIR